MNQLVDQDLVCGMDVSVDNPAAKSEFEARIYYFCSQDCQQRFERDPGLYIGKLEIREEKEPQNPPVEV